MKQLSENIKTLGRDLECIAPGRVTYSADLSQHSSWKIGGKAAVLIEPASTQEIQLIIKRMAGLTFPLVVIGHGTNILFDDDGINGVVLKIGNFFSDFSFTKNGVWTQTGIWTPIFAKNVGCAGFTGIEHTIGIPGTIGGLVMMNGGSQQKGIGENIKTVTCIDHAGECMRLTKKECEFAYRYSVMQRMKTIVVEAEFEFNRGDVKAIRRAMIEILSSRRKKFPLNLPSCGSVFVSTPSMYKGIGAPSYVIEILGLKGLRRGDAQVSEHHANFIVNLGHASSKDVLWLIHSIRAKVFSRTGYLLKCEARHIGINGQIRNADEVADRYWNFGELS